MNETTWPGLTPRPRIAAASRRDRSPNSAYVKRRGPSTTPVLAPQRRSARRRNVNGVSGTNMPSPPRSDRATRGGQRRPRTSPPRGRGGRRGDATQQQVGELARDLGPAQGSAGRIPTADPVAGAQNDEPGILGIDP